MYNDDKYIKLASCAFSSFKKFHPGIDTYLINHYNIHSFFPEYKMKTIPGGIEKYQISLMICKKFNYNKVIILGADTITCSFLHEFINDESNDILATLDYPYYLSTSYFSTPFFDEDHCHCNADVVCFNDIRYLEEVIKESFKFSSIGYYEQAALNEIIFSKKYNNITYNIVDHPYHVTNKPIYNVRAKGNICAESGTKPWKQYLSQFKIIDNKLINKDGKQIKVWHYCDGFGGLPNDKVEQLVNWYKDECFTNDVKNFFNIHCDCGDFFSKEFKI